VEALILPSVAELITQIAAHATPKYNGVVEQSDVEQEMWVWVLSSGATLTTQYTNGEVDEKLYRFKLRNSAVKYCERERKSTLGYDWRDDYDYSRPEVARLLPLALDPSSIPGLSGGSLHDGPSAKSDPAYGGGMLASIVDIRAAFAKLSPADQGFVQSVVDHDLDWDTIAEHHELASNSAYQKWMRILDKMVTKHLSRRFDHDVA
jgi:hypothetical protein